MSSKSDSVFQVSLTEIAFTLVLLMILLLGSMLTGALNKNKEQEKQIQAQAERIDFLHQMYDQYGGIFKPDPNEPIDPMMPCIKCVSVAGKTSKDEAEKSLKLGQQIMEQWKSRSREKDSFEKFKKEMLMAASKVADGQELVMNDEKQSLLEQASKALKENKALKKNNETLRASGEYFKRKAGMDKPPCWILAESYKPQYLFNILILEDSSYVVTKNWPNEREAEALSIPGVKEMIAKKHLSKEDFNRYAYKIFQTSEHRKPQACRYFVTMTSRIPDRITGDYARLNLEQFFYKYEKINTGK